MVRGNICYNCGEELEDWYVEEGDITVSRKKIVCPSCGWTLEGARDFHEEDVEESEHEKD
jgi:DNA-directed RNA polymerase subunit RPC12/RpoP